MSTAKRTRQQQQQQQTTAAASRPAKRARIAQDQNKSLAYLTDERQRVGKTIEAKITNGTNSNRLDAVDESHALISSHDAENESMGDGDDASMISSSSEEPSSESDGELNSHEEKEQTTLDIGRPLTNGDMSHPSIAESGAKEQIPDGAIAPTTNGIDSSPEAMEEDDIVDQGGPSFGELLQAANPDIIDVTATFDDLDNHTKALAAPSRSNALQIPSGTSLGTVLSQALRTNDRDLLESCLQTKDLGSIKATIQRLQSPLVATLMSRLAERLHKRPGRAGPLMLWIQWSLIAHGGYLAGQPALVKKLRSLRLVLRERAHSLQPLITLKGKLDMLGAQIELRRAIRAQRAGNDDTEDENDDIVYVDDGSDESSDDEQPAASKFPKSIKGGPAKIRAVLESARRARQNDVAEETDGDVPLINGIDEDAQMESLGEEEDDDDDDEELDAGGLVDDEAEESDLAESISSEEDDSGDDSGSAAAELDDSSASSDDEAEVEAAPPRPRKRSALIRKR